MRLHAILHAATCTSVKTLSLMFTDARPQESPLTQERAGRCHGHYFKHPTEPRHYTLHNWPCSLQMARHSPDAEFEARQEAVDDKTGPCLAPAAGRQALLAP